MVYADRIAAGVAALSLPGILFLINEKLATIFETEKDYALSKLTFDNKLR